MPIYRMPYMSSGFSTGPNLENARSGQLLAYLIGYFPDWNLDVDGKGKIKANVLEAGNVMLHVKEIFFRGADLNGELQLEWGVTEALEQSFQYEFHDGGVKTVCSLDPLAITEYQLAGFTHIYGDEFSRPKYSNSWNGLFHLSEAKLGIGRDECLYFIFYDLTAQDRVYMYINYERIVEEPDA